MLPLLGNILMYLPKVNSSSRKMLFLKMSVPTGIYSVSFRPTELLCQFISPA